LNASFRYNQIDLCGHALPTGCAQVRQLAENAALLAPAASYRGSRSITSTGLITQIIERVSEPLSAFAVVRRAMRQPTIETA